MAMVLQGLPGPKCRLKSALFRDIRQTPGEDGDNNECIIRLFSLSELKVLILHRLPSGPLSDAFNILKKMKFLHHDRFGRR